MSAKEGFKRFENGEFTGEALNGQLNMKIDCRQNNVLFGVITAKKSWGLWVNEWSQGIAECNFTIEEIIGEFTSKKIKVPEFLYNELVNAVYKKKCEIYEKILNEHTSSK